MIKKNNIITGLTVLLILFHLIGFHKITNIVILALVVTVITYNNPLKKLKQLANNFKFWMLILPFLLFALSLLYTTNINEGWKLTELRLSLLIIPFIFGMTSFSKEHKWIILKFFIFITALLPLVGFLANIPNYLNTLDTGYFYNDNLVLIFNKQAAYYGMYINFALIGLFYIWQNNELKNNTQKGVSITLLILLLIAQYLLASRTAMLISLISIISFVLILGITKIGKKKASVLLLGLGILVAILIFTFPKVLKRFESIKQIEYKFDNPNEINHFNGEIKATNWNGLNTRLAIWNCAWDEVKKKPFLGGGIGSQQENLIRNYESKNFNFAVKSNYNSHNQYLDILLSNGFLGLFVFLFFLGYLVLNAIQTKNWLLLGILIVFIISCITENILSRNQGVLIIWLFLSLLLKPNNMYKSKLLN